MGSAVIAGNFINSKKAEYIRFAEQLGATIRFSDDKWVCDTFRRSQAETPSKYTIYFSGIPERYKEIVKYFSVISIIQGRTIGTVSSDVLNLCKFFDFWSANYTDSGFHTCGESAAAGFYDYLERRGLAESTKARMWGTIRVFSGLWTDGAEIF